MNAEKLLGLLEISSTDFFFTLPFIFPLSAWKSRDHAEELHSLVPFSNSIFRYDMHD